MAPASIDFLRWETFQDPLGFDELTSQRTESSLALVDLGNSHLTVIGWIESWDRALSVAFIICGTVLLLVSLMSQKKEKKFFDNSMHPPTSILQTGGNIDIFRD